MTAKPIRFLRLLAAATALMLAVTGLLAACGGDEASDQVQAPQSPPPFPLTGTPSTGGEATEPAVDRPDLTNTPVLASDALLYEQALDRARTDLAARLNIRPEEITVIPRDTPLAMQSQIACPPPATPVPGQTATPDPALLNISVYRLYLQYKQLVYPYQFFQPAGEDAKLVVWGCEPVADTQVLYVPTPDARAAILQQVRDTLIAQNVDPDAGAVLVRAMTWSDSALNCPPAAGETVTSEIIEGYLVRYTLDTGVYEYHADSTGERIRLCQAPGENYTSVDEFMAALQADPDLVVQRLEGEVVQYEGLAQPGEVLLLTLERWRMGVIPFDSPATARAAAKQITDPRVLRIFAAGSLLVVQEMPSSPEVSGILLNYAQEIRNPQAEREAAAQATAQFQAQQLASGTPVLPPEIPIPTVPPGGAQTPTIPAWLLTPPTVPPTPPLPPH